MNLHVETSYRKWLVELFFYSEVLPASDLNYASEVKLAGSYFEGIRKCRKTFKLITLLYQDVEIQDRTGQDRVFIEHKNIIVVVIIFAKK